MKFGKKSRDKRLAALLSQHPDCGDPEFIASVQTIIDARDEARPAASPLELLQTIQFCWSFANSFRECHREHERTIIAAERQRIAAVINHAAENGICTHCAMQILTDTDLPADAVIGVLQAKQNGVN